MLRSEEIVKVMAMLMGPHLTLNLNITISSPLPLAHH
jgi:hypothetical protein